MNVRAIVREAWRNVVSGTTRAVLFCAVLAAICGVALALDISSILRLEEAAAVFRESAASTLTVTAPGRVDGARCEALGGLPGVRATGAIALPDERITAVALPGAPIPAAYVTPGFASVLRAHHDDGGGLVLPRDALETLGLSMGDAFVTTAGVSRVSGSYDYPRDGRRSGYGYVVLVPAGERTVFDECWVDAWPQDQSLNSLLLLTVLPGSGEDGDEPQVAQLNASLGTEFDAHGEYAGRFSRFGGVVAGLAGVVVGFVAVRVRRVELASALHDRMRRLDLWTILLLESIVWIVPPLLIGLVAATAFLGSGGDGVVALVVGARILLPATLGGLLGVSLGLAVTREKDLFRYAKDR